MAKRGGVWRSRTFAGRLVLAFLFFWLVQVRRGLPHLHRKCATALGIFTVCRAWGRGKKESKSSEALLYTRRGATTAARCEEHVRQREENGKTRRTLHCHLFMCERSLCCIRDFHGVTKHAYPFVGRPTPGALHRRSKPFSRVLGRRPVLRGFHAQPRAVHRPERRERACHTLLLLFYA